MTLEQKEKNLQKAIKAMGRVLVAFSGGVDSTYLLKIAINTLGSDNVLAACAVSPVMPRLEQQQAVALAKKIGARIVIVQGPEMSNLRFLKNDARRCYWCKRDRFRELKKIARQHKLPYVLEGSNADDLADYRPGMRAVAELGIKSPLLAAGLGKPEIRQLSHRLGLSTWKKPAAACLASRITYGTNISEELLARIAAAERILHKQGFLHVRVRHHGDIARIEVPARDISKVVRLSMLKKITADFKKLGWGYVTLDLEGYSTGSLNRTIEKK